MQKFTRHRTVDELKIICAERGFRIKTDRYESGDDHIGIFPVIDGEVYGVVYNGFNGRFFGDTPGGVLFESDMADLDAEPWFQALLDLFYTNDPRASDDEAA
jgi:hypothetical protein